MSNNYKQNEYSVETQELQEELYKNGYLEIKDIDGVFGPVTKSALDAYKFDLEVKPLPEKPWWQSKRGKGMAKMLGGIAASVIAMFWAGASEIDVKEVVDLIYTAGPQLDVLLEAGKQVIEIGGALLVAFGFGQSAIGAIKAKQPIDPTLIAKVNGKEIRFPIPKKTPTEESHDIWLDN